MLIFLLLYEIWHRSEISYRDCMVALSHHFVKVAFDAVGSKDLSIGGPG